MAIEETLDRLQEVVEELTNKLDKKIVAKQQINPENLKKNSHLHLFMETSLHDKLKKEATEKAMTLSELVRWKLRENNQFNRIERKIDKILENMVR